MEISKCQFFFRLPHCVLIYAINFNMKQTPCLALAFKYIHIHNYVYI